MPVVQPRVAILVCSRLLLEHVTACLSGGEGDMELVGNAAPYQCYTCNFSQVSAQDDYVWKAGISACAS